LWIVLLANPSQLLRVSGLLAVITTYSCGAARDFHPLPYSSAGGYCFGGHPDSLLHIGSAVVAEQGKKSKLSNLNEGSTA
jgi:hypothetical protein